MMPGYDSWKTRSPDDDLGDPSMYEKPDPAQEQADWQDAKLECEMCAGSKWKSTCPECDGTGYYTPDAPVSRS